LTIEVPAHHSSQECSHCGCTHPDNRPSQAAFICHACDFVANADHNASLVIKQRGVTAVLDGTVGIRVPKKVGFTKSAARRAGAARTDAEATWSSTPVERLSAVSGASLGRSSQRSRKPTPEPVRLVAGSSCIP
jgi:putative transposase